MAGELVRTESDDGASRFERIKRVNAAGNEHWSSRDFSRVLDYSDYRNFELVVAKARIACFNGGLNEQQERENATKRVPLAA